jgi:hypothetical protein
MYADNTSTHRLEAFAYSSKKDTLAEIVSGKTSQLQESKELNTDQLAMLQRSRSHVPDRTSLG